MALKYVKLVEPLTALEAGILKKIGLKVLGDKLFIEEDMIKADRPSVGRKSRRKGGNHERKVVTALSEWWTNGGDKNAFARTPRSGAWKFPLDIVPPRGCPLLVSCKNEERWAGLEMLLESDGAFKTYWNELDIAYNDILKHENLFMSVTGVGHENVISVLIFTRNFKPDYIMMNVSDYNALVGYVGAFMKRKITSMLFLEDYQLNNKREFVTMLLKDFFEWVTPEVIKLYSERKKIED